jgi:hypothetical protein
MLEVNTFWAFVLEIGFVGWLLSAVLFIFKAWDEEDNFYPRKAALWGVILVVFYAIWVVGLMRA